MTRAPMMSETLAETLQCRMRRAPPPTIRPAVTPLRRMLAGLTAGVLAVSVVLASTIPARADDRDDLIAALAALALLGIVINETNNDREAPVVISPAPQPFLPYPPQAYPPQAYPPTPYPPIPYPAYSVRVPAACAIEVEGRNHRDVVFYTESCLRTHGVGRLPQRCAREVTVRGRKDWVYGQPCLREAGFRFESR